MHLIKSDATYHLRFVRTCHRYLLAPFHRLCMVNPQHKLFSPRFPSSLRLALLIPNCFQNGDAMNATYWRHMLANCIMVSGWFFRNTGNGDGFGNKRKNVVGNRAEKDDNFFKIKFFNSYLNWFYPFYWIALNIIHVKHLSQETTEAHCKFWGGVQSDGFYGVIVRFFTTQKMIEIRHWKQFESWIQWGSIHYSSL